LHAEHVRDLIRESVRVALQELIELEATQQIGAAPYERTETRTAYRNGYRTRAWDTRVGSVELKIPKVTAGTYFPSRLEPRKRAEKALQAVIVEGAAEWITPSPDDGKRLTEASKKKYGYALSPDDYAKGTWSLRPKRALAWTEFPKDCTRFLFT
jgi:transposase-like protein